MTKSRKDFFSDKEQTLARWCKALAHPARIAILKTLAQRGECICGELVLDLPLAQSTVSQHLKTLKSAGLIQGELEGPRSRYCIDQKNLKRFIKAFTELATRLDKQTSSLLCTTTESQK